MRKKSASDLVNEAMKEIETREAKDIKKLYDNGSCNLIDIRDIRELWKTGVSSPGPPGQAPARTDAGE